MCIRDRLREARERGVPARTEALEAHADSPADILAEYMLSYTEARFDAAGRVEPVSYTHLALRSSFSM